MVSKNSLIGLMNLNLGTILILVSFLWLAKMGQVWMTKGKNKMNVSIQLLFKQSLVKRPKL